MIAQSLPLRMWGHAEDWSEFNFSMWLPLSVSQIGLQVSIPNMSTGSIKSFPTIRVRLNSGENLTSLYSARRGASGKPREENEYDRSTTSCLLAETDAAFLSTSPSGIFCWMGGRGGRLWFSRDPPAHSFLDVTCLGSIAQKYYLPGFSLQYGVLIIKNWECWNVNIQ